MILWIDRLSQWYIDSKKTQPRVWSSRRRVMVFFFFFLRAYTWINLFRNSIRYTEQESSWIRQVCDVVSSRNIHWWFRQLYACIIYPVIIREPFRMVSSAILCAKSCPSPRWRVGGNEKISTYNPVLLKYVISRGLITSHNSLNAC